MQAFASSVALIASLCSVAEGLFVDGSSRNLTVNTSSLNKSLQLHLVDGYSDCQKQVPTGPEWWHSRAYGHKATESGADDQRPIYKFPNRDAVVCTPPKSGCTYWKALLMRMEGNPDWNHPNEGKRHFNNGLDTRNWHVFKKPESLTLMLVRNPLVRLLSAFMNKRADTTGYYHDLLKGFSNTPLGFRQFIYWILASDARHQELDVHWRKQGEHCGLSESAGYDFYLKVECRALWSPSLFDKLQIHQFTDSGWGSDGRQQFIPVGDSGAAKPTDIQGAKYSWKTTDSHTTEASNVAKVCKWYSGPTFQKVQTLYHADIHAFGYADDVKRLGEACGFL